MLIKISEITILEAARYFHGPLASLWPNDGHALKYAAKKPGDETRYPIDLQAYSNTKYSADWRVVLSGMGKSEWAWFNPFYQTYQIVPVIQVASDVLWNVQEVNAARDNFAHNVKQVAEFYRAQLGKTFQVHEPILFYSNRDSRKWYDIYQQCTKAETRFMLYDTVRMDLEAAFGRRINSNLIFVAAQYCGNQPTWDWGAAGGGWLNVVSAFACCHRYKPETAGQWEQTVAYALAHEIGHCFGLPHTDSLRDTSKLDYNKAVMLRGFPPNALFAPYEKEILNNNAFFGRS